MGNVRQVNCQAGARAGVVVDGDVAALGLHEAAHDREAQAKAVALRNIAPAKFLEKHPQFEWMTGLMKDRPREPWVVFKSGEK